MTHRVGQLPDSRWVNSVTRPWVNYLTVHTPAASHLSTRTAELLLEHLSADAAVGCAPHRLRHTFAKALFDAGVPAERVAAILGHESLDTTAIYTKATPEDLAAAAEKVAWE